ncbi:hypothetical protein SDRG_14993 [Saprolegnia diclina VS20]|uniref:WRKY19-like zinc finger domain-containing protein n=1 Tax=Saprolegnia diclina (strain VS20) TaxID=1156394 RepID=T0PY58_SAPDV|nr:hypothetical protein SDRG_14993 [Saprolegnia diclina VS20]EQC27191.1 hypothetical protein SDRG_14993 [Saprolegnia diclina VS20]|eukprot:XP_008619378.1 hypothetical protein SDRG_14993 [Saprolegnia diclina VS20]
MQGQQQQQGPPTRQHAPPPSEVPVNAQLLRDMMDCVDVSSFSMERKESWAKLRTLVSGDDAAAAEMRAEQLLHAQYPYDSASQERKFNVKESATKLKRLLSSQNFSMNEKKASVSALVGLLETQAPGGISRTEATELLRSLGDEIPAEELKRLSSSNMFKSFIMHADGMTRKKSFDVLQGILNATSNSALQRPMTSQDSFRFQTLANCLESIESDVAKYAAEEVAEDDDNEYVVSVDNLDNLLDDKIVQPTTYPPREKPAPANARPPQQHPQHPSQATPAPAPTQLPAANAAPSASAQANNGMHPSYPGQGSDERSLQQHAATMSAMSQQQPVRGLANTAARQPINTQYPGLNMQQQTSHMTHPTMHMYHDTYRQQQQQQQQQQQLHASHLSQHPSMQQYSMAPQAGAYYTNGPHMYQQQQQAAMYQQSNYAMQAAAHQHQQQQQQHHLHHYGHLPSAYASAAAPSPAHYEQKYTAHYDAGKYEPKYEPKYAPDAAAMAAPGNSAAYAKFCMSPGCNNIARTKGMCKVHGGGRRCKVEGCMKSAQTGHLCIAHGGGKPCRMEGCPKTAQSRGLCKQHGGGVRCKFEGCTKSCQSGGFCRGHGGGKRCEFPQCKKWAQRNGFCAKHAQELASNPA